MIYPKIMWIKLPLVLFTAATLVAWTASANTVASKTSNVNKSEQKVLEIVEWVKSKTHEALWIVKNLMIYWLKMKNFLHLRFMLHEWKIQVYLKKKF